MSEPSTPPGYESFLAGRARVVARTTLANALHSVMAGGSLHAWAARQPGARAMQGRATAWATTLPNGVEVVVRHSRHGGLLAPLTGDLFLAPTRAPFELAAALRLADAGVPTPDVLAYAVYPAIGPFARADVATRLLHGRGLPEAWKATTSHDERWALVGVLSRLLDVLRRAGAHHPDLNVRNVLVLDAAPGPTAAILDVDRVTFGTPGDATLAGRNVRRLLRSMAKERVGYGVDLTSRQVQRLRETAGAGA
ncbi:MAG TPA: lipopolysaccharide kinase InaA family protein [Gemmatimonadaceae bacterium]